MAEQQQFQIMNANLAIPYADMAVSTFGPFGFRFDFIQNIAPGQAQIMSRVGMSPQHAKAFLAALSDGIKNFEAQFGEIKVTQAMQQAAAEQQRGMGFQAE